MPEGNRSEYLGEKLMEKFKLLWGYPYESRMRVEVPFGSSAMMLSKTFENSPARFDM
jgi:hypothetical protein